VGVAAVDHQVGALPGTLIGDVGVLFGHPAHVRGGGDLTGSHPFGIAGEPGRLVRLNLDGDGQLCSYGSLGSAYAFEDEVLQVARKLDCAFPVKDQPSRWPIAEGMA
jgi:hypothetical protein